MPSNKQVCLFKEKIKKGAVIGVFSKTSDPAFIECMGYGGLDFVILDLEHGPQNIYNLQNLLRAAECSGILPVVRVRENEYNLINQALDIGAAGIQVPHIQVPEDIDRVLKYSKFHPYGQRGLCRFVRSASYSAISGKEYLEQANDNIIIIQIEGKKGFDNLDRIISNEGFDILFIGPYDLSQSLGIPGQTGHPDLIKVVKEIVIKCNEKGITTGIFSDTIPEARKWMSQGVKYISYSVDVGIFYDASKKIAEELKNL